MKRSYVADVISNDLQKVLVKGWVFRINCVGKVAFVHLRDKTGIIQVVADDTMIRDLRLEMSIEAIGNRVVNDKAPSGVEYTPNLSGSLEKSTMTCCRSEINKGRIKASLETRLDHRTSA